jgi:hypothetical protein
MLGRMVRQSHRRKSLPSERGLLELVEGETHLSTKDALTAFRRLIAADMDWADSRKIRFRRSAAMVRISALVLTAASTVVLGIGTIPARASIALPMVAGVTLLSALDAFFNWRSRWVLMEETQYRLNRLRDEIDFLLVAGKSEQLTQERLQGFFVEQQLIWADVSRRWVEFRRTSQSQEAPPSMSRNEGG